MQVWIVWSSGYLNIWPAAKMHLRHFNFPGWYTSELWMFRFSIRVFLSPSESSNAPSKHFLANSRPVLLEMGATPNIFTPAWPHWGYNSTPPPKKKNINKILSCAKWWKRRTSWKQSWEPKWLNFSLPRSWDYSVLTEIYF